MATFPFYVDFTSTHAPSGWTSATYTVRVNLIQTYYSDKKTSDISLDSIQIKKAGNDTTWAYLPLYGSVYIGSASNTLISLDNASSGKRAQVTVSGGNFCTWNPTSVTKTTRTVTHNDNGSCTITVGITGGYSIEGVSYFGAKAVQGSSENIFGAPSSSKTATLTNIGHTLTTAVSPSGSGYGTVTPMGSTTLAPTSTKQLTANPKPPNGQYTYTFKSWSVSGTGAKVTDATSATTTFTMGSANATVTANFERVNTSHTLTLTKGNYVSSVTGGGTKKYDDSVTAVATLGSATGYTYSFSGWFKDGTGTAKSTSLSYTFAMPSSDLLLTAIGTRTANSYTLTISRNNSNYGTVAGHTSGNTVQYGKSVTLTATPSAATGYTTTFSKWTVSGTGSELTSTTNTTTTFTMGIANATVTAYFNRTANSYSVKFNANGGSGSMNDQSFTYGTAQNLTANQFTRTNYTFNSWNTKSDGTGSKYNNGQSVSNLVTTNNGSITLYARWDYTPTKYTITYNANGHGTAPANQEKIDGEALTLQPFISNQTGTGSTLNYTLTGNVNGGTWASGSTTHDGSASRTPNQKYVQTAWNTKSNGTGTSYASKASYNTNSAATLYAIWNTTIIDYTYGTTVLPTNSPTKTETYTITFNANTGSISGSNTANSTRTGALEGWYTAASGGTKVTSSTPFTTDANIYAHYTTPAFSKVTTLSSTCTKSGYILKGWAETSTGVVKYAPSQQFIPTKSQTLYAIWEQGTFAINYLSDHGDPPASQVKVADVALTLQPFITDQLEDSNNVEGYTINVDRSGGYWVGTTGQNAAASRRAMNLFQQTYWHDNTHNTNYGSSGSYTLNEAAEMSAKWTSSIAYYNRAYVVPTAIASKSENIIITFDANHGLISGSSTSSVSANRIGSLEGWYTANGTERVTKTWTGGTQPGTGEWKDANETIYAHYTMPNFSSVVTPTPTECRRANYSLLGWGENPNEVKYGTGITFVPTQATTLYAIWGTSNIVYVGTDRCQTFIYHNNEWSQYRAYIGNNNHEWIPY